MQPSDALSSSAGGRPATWKHRIQDFLDRVYDALLRRNRDFARIAEEAAASPLRRVLVAAVEVPERSAALDVLLQSLRQCRHHVTVVRAELEPGRGKFENISRALQAEDLSTFDWLLIVDDDVDLPPSFLDRFVYLSERFGLAMSQPAHRFHSFRTWPITRRAAGTLARRSRFVECGPVTAFHKSAFAHVFPFPPSRWGWSLDFLWAETAIRNDLAVGVLDALPMRHTRPVGGGYSLDQARTDMRVFLQQQGVTRPRRQYMVNVARWKRLPAGPPPQG